MKLFYDFLGKLLLLLPLLNEHFVVKYMYVYNNYCKAQVSETNRTLSFTIFTYG